MKSGTVFDNILITDDEDYAKQVGDNTWGVTKVGQRTSTSFVKNEEDKTAV